MVNLADAIYVLFPSAMQPRDYELIDDGTGPRISDWSFTAPQPTADQLAAVTTDQVVEARLSAARTEALTTAMSRADHTAIATRAYLNAIVYLVNNRLEALGQPRVLEAEIEAFIAANPTIGDPTA